MNSLLESVVQAHGGIERWRSLRRVEATVVSGGILWGMKGVVQTADPRRLTAWLHEQRTSITAGGEMRADYSPDRVALVKGDTVVTERANPRASFAGHEKHTPWDPLQRIYFGGYALWTYLTTPFLLTMDGVQVEETSDWIEDGERWRVLRARFPSLIATHSPIQDFFFGEDFLLRRHDYDVDIAGGFDAAQLVSNYVEVNGILLPTRRRAYTRTLDRKPSSDPAMVEIDLTKIRYA